MLSPIDPTPDQWDTFVRRQPHAHALQLWRWGELKGAFGWDAARVAIGEDGKIVAGAQVLFRALPFNTGRMAYLPMGPYATTAEQRQYLWKRIDKLVSTDRRAAFLTWEPGIIGRDDPQPDFKRFGFRPAAQTIQPPRTILIDIRGDEDAILGRMNQGTRRKIRQSQKNGITYYEAARNDVAKFNGMMQTTGDRNEFGVHAPEYYELAYDLFVPQGDAALIMAEHDGDPLAAVMVFALGRTAWYLYGASSSVKRNLMAAYGVQWQAIQWAKARGCHTYDMWGVPDEDPVIMEATFQQRSDDLWGVYGFKRGWGGEVVRSLGTWDKAYNGLIYNAYRMAAILRQYL